MTLQKESFDFDEAFRRLRIAVAGLPKAAMFELRDRGHGSLFALLRRIANELGGVTPDTPEGLMTFRGVGPTIAALVLGVALHARATAYRG